MRSSACLLVLFCWYIVATFGGSIKIRNLSPSPICYGVEITSGSVPTNAVCNDIMPGILVAGHQNVTISPSANWNGAFTDFRNWTRGARHEINYAFGPDMTWYDIDYEMGISNSTLGPANGRKQLNGLPSLIGEKDCLAKANMAWKTTANKGNLSPHYYYLVQGAHGSNPNGNLTGLRMDKKAPLEVTWFLQMEANLTAYVYHGSVAETESALSFERIVTTASRAESMAKLTQAADKHSWSVGGQEMVITAY